MSLSISSNGSLGMLRSLFQTQQRLERTYMHLATGKRITGASDDAAGLAISERFTAQIRGFAQGERNLADGVSYANTTEGTLQSSHDSLQRMRELSVQAQNGTLSDADRATIQQEFDQLADTLDQVAPEVDSKSFTDGNGGEVTVDVADASASGLGVGGLDASDPATLDAIDGAIDQVSAQRSSLGTAANKMSFRSELMGTMREGLESSRSMIADLDFAMEVSKLTRDRILQNMQLSGLKMTMNANRAALNLLA